MDEKKLRIPDIITTLQMETDEKRALAILHNNNTPAFRIIVDYALGDWTFRTDLIPETFQGKKVIDHLDMSLFAEARRLYIWLNDNKLDDKRRRTLLKDLLECLPYDEAQLVVKVMRREVKEEGFFNVEFLTKHIKSISLKHVLSKTFNEIKFVPAKVSDFKINPKYTKPDPPELAVQAPKVEVKAPEKKRVAKKAR